MPEVTAAPASERVRAEWSARIVAEYTSAAVTHELVLWLIQAGAPPDLLDAGLAVVGDELVHARLSQEVHEAAGGGAPPAIDRAALALARGDGPLEHAILRATVRVLCLGETVAVPLFRHLRERCTAPPARAALDRILRDEVRHRDLGWDLLDWACATQPDAPALVAAELPAMLAELDAGYGRGNPVVAGDDGEITDAERAWGLAPPREYAAILAETLDRALRPRFSARGIVIHV